MNNSKHGSSAHVNKITEWIGVAAFKTWPAATRHDICSTERFGVVIAVLHLKCAYCCCDCQTQRYTVNEKSPHHTNETSTHDNSQRRIKKKNEWRKKSFSCKTKMACTCTSWNCIIGRSIFKEIFVKNLILNRIKSILCDPYGVKNHTNFGSKPIVLVLFHFGVPQMSWFFISQTGEEEEKKINFNNLLNLSVFVLSKNRLQMYTTHWDERRKNE